MLERLKVINPLRRLSGRGGRHHSSPRASRAPVCWRTTSTCSSSCWRTLSVSENRRAARRARRPGFADFASRENNRIAVCQFKVRVLGTEQAHPRCRVVPQRPASGWMGSSASRPRSDAIPEAIDQLLRYSEHAGPKGETCAALRLQPVRRGRCRRKPSSAPSPRTRRRLLRWAEARIEP